jgi:hypothetical protein
MTSLQQDDLKRIGDSCPSTGPPFVIPVKSRLNRVVRQN